jgi:putative phosphoesterase
MRWGVFSDIHGNLDAFEAVLEVLEKEGAQKYICCGDFVGYGPQPNEVVERVRQLPEILAVRGNHDLAVLGRMDLEWFNDNAAAAVVYAQDMLSEDNFNWLKELPPMVKRDEFTVVHGSPRNTAEEYLVTVQQFHDNLKYYKSSPCFVGHSHIPVCFLMKEPVSYVEAGQLEHGQQLLCPKDTRVVVNPGSVGQPRDQDFRASCGIYDDEKRVFTLHRVEYDVALQQKKIRDAGLPEFLAARLAYGQ